MTPPSEPDLPPRGGAVRRVAVLVSGGGSNLQSLLDFAAEGRSWRIALVVSDRPGIRALERAAAAGVPGIVVDPDPPGPEEGQLGRVLDAHAIDAILLAGYLRLVPAEVVRRWRGRILNIHPALLPSFGGKGMYGRRIHEAVLAAGAKVTGVTVHEVNEVFDQGRILAQWPVPVLRGDDPGKLAARVLRVEHLLYPLVADAYLSASGSLDGVGAHREEGGGWTFTLPGAAFHAGYDDAALADQIRAALPPHQPSSKGPNS